MFNNILLSIIWVSAILYFLGYNLWWIINFFRNPISIKQRFYKDIGKAKLSFITCRVYLWRSTLFHAVVNLYEDFIFIKRFRSSWLINKDNFMEFKPIPQSKFFNLFQTYKFKIKVNNIYKTETIYFLLTPRQVNIITNFLKSNNILDN